MGSELDQVAQAIAKALRERNWGCRTFKAGAMTRRTLAEFAPFAYMPEVRDLVRDIRIGNPVDGLRLKYLKRKYLENEPIQGPEDIDAWFERVLSDKDATLRRRVGLNGRYVAHSASHQLTAVIDPSGLRVSVFEDDGQKLEPVWLKLSELMKATP
jgi:hypothetical protein